MCLYRSGQTHVKLSANKEVTSNDGFPELIYSVDNKTLKHLLHQAQVVPNNRLVKKCNT